MATPARKYTILMVDDDSEDCLLVRDALLEIDHHCDLRFVRDGEELFDYLNHRGEYESVQSAPPPDLILMDLKMPKKDGRETLREIKVHPDFKQIPVVALTTSTSEDDIRFSYEVGANSYVTKPVTFRALVDTMQTLSKYWFEVAELPLRE